MNITVNSNSGIYQTGNQINAGGRQVISELSANPESAVISSDKLTLLKAGDVFSGQIMEMNDDGTVSIMLGNNASLKAQLSSDLSVNIGQMLSFQVKTLTVSFKLLISILRILPPAWARNKPLPEYSRDLQKGRNYR